MPDQTVQAEPPLTAKVEATLSSGREVTVEVRVRRGLPEFAIASAPDASVREVRERVRAGLLNTGFEFPLQRVTVSVEPEPEPGEWEWFRDGGVLTYWIARAILAATGQAEAPSPIAAHTLSLGGQVTTITGRKQGLRELIESEANYSTVEVKRLARLKALVAEFGIADDCDTLSEFEADDRPQYALMEAAASRGGGPWWSVGPTISYLLERSAGQEFPEDWPAETVFDLDSDRCWEVKLAYRVESPTTCGPLAAEVEKGGES